MKHFLKSFSLQLGVFISVIATLGVVYAAWDDTVGTGDPLSSSSWNTLVGKVKDIDDVIRINGGNVGIGTNNPGSRQLMIVSPSGQAKQEIQSQAVGALSNASLEISNSVSSFDLQVRGDAGNVFRIRQAGQNPITVEPGSVTNQLYLKSGGKTGIGTANPIDTLQVESSDTTVLGINTTGGVFNSRAILAFDRGGAQRWDIGVNTNNGDTNNLYIRKLGTPSNYIMTFLENGNVGVSELNPAATLDVGGDVRVGNSSATCDTTTEGSIRYNGSVHQGCNGTSWNNLY